MRTVELDFHLPPELIAQTPPEQRTASRLLHYCRATKATEHTTFSDLPSLLRPGDLLVFNDARVIPARFMLRKSTGGRVEGLFLEETQPGEWRVLLRNLGSVPPVELCFADDPTVRVSMIEGLGAGEFRVAVTPSQPAGVLLDRLGRMPLPPYIKRDKEHDPRDEMDRARYQTVFARSAGAVAAPTAALHFSPELLDELAAAGLEQAFVTLNVGMGTFKPVTADALQDHAMHVESYSLSEPAADALNRAKTENRRVIAVGTTAARVLESQPAGEPFVPRAGATGIFIYPPYRWKHVDALITNFHLPRSTLIALVAAMVGLDEQRRLYRIAIESRYRFFSYGDALFIE